MISPSIFSLRLVLLYSVPLLLLAFPLRVHGSTVEVPIKLDYPLLHQLLVKQLFKAPGQTAELLDDPSGCNQIVLSNPHLSGKPPYLEIVTDVSARFGMSVLEACTQLSQWQGSAGFLGRPHIQSEGTALRVEIVDSWLIPPDGGRTTSGKVWDLVKDHFHAHFNQYELDLTPSISALGMLLPDVLPRHAMAQLQAIIGSMKAREILVTRDNVDVTLSFQVDELPEQPRTEATLSSEEFQQLESRWQEMDALFTYAIKYYASLTGDQELREAMLEILLDSRYRLRDALTEPSSPTNDPVRRWFLDSWQLLNPIIRRIGLEHTGQEPLLWISLVTATDALYALDRLGPTVGLDISSDGLRRLARLINNNAGPEVLRYDLNVDPQLQRLFRLPVSPAPGQPSGLLFDIWPISAAHAETSIARLNRWAPNRDQLGDYLPLVADLLNEIAQDALKQTRIEPQQASEIFQTLVLATAWQESCWRQYVRSKKKIVPLRSTSGDVGLMQLNERVWRGFYDIEKLRWDIDYNGRAGGDVLINYLVKYALRKGEHKHSGGFDNLARATYSAYNGGPAQVSRYRRGGVASTHKKVDTAFWKKYQQVKAGHEMQVAQCLGGKPIVASSTQAPVAMPGKSAKKQNPPLSGTKSKDAGERWVLAQNANHYTLQLAVFSKRDSAQRFIAQQSLSTQAIIYPVRKAQATQFAVLYESYAKRADAQRAAQRLKGLKPWVRRFSDLQKAGTS